VRKVEVRSPELREPLDASALRSLEGWTVRDLGRRAKYLLVALEHPGEPARLLVIHLGMSGRLTVVASDQPYAKHEHLALHLGNSEGRPQGRLRLVDPRRFGLAFVLDAADLEADRHFVHLGIEPLVGSFDGAYLAEKSQGRRGPVKAFLMDATVVVGVGNIYASEALWRAKVHPRRSVARIGAASWQRLADAVREVLWDAIEQGGTTLNDFTDGDGNAGYFQVSLDVYDREGEPCRRCDHSIRRIVQSNRSTYFCPGCQR
jgi:formamidopyrimidine-DNA glycosylase